MLWWMVAGLLLSGSVGAAVPADAPVRGGVARITLDGPIGPAAAEYVDDAMQRALDDGAVAVVLQLDTPGGLSDAMRQIIARILANPVPVLVYVAPGGARAASAGTYILYAAQVAAMAPATHLGAATPVSLGGSTPMPLPKTIDKPAPSSSSKTKPADEPADAESNKVLNDAIAYIRSLAQLRGRNAEWAEQAVRGAATLTAEEAAKQRVIDFVATDTAELLSKADGRRVRVAEREVTLQLKGLAVRDYPPSARSQFLGIITNPTIAYLLLMAGIVGLFLEATHPGVLLPGVAGGICLLIGLYALQLLPVSYAGLALIALGIGLMVAEAVTPTVGALGVGGVIAFVLGSILLMHSGVPGYAVNLGVIAAIAVSAVGLLAWILWLVFESQRSRQSMGESAMLEEFGVMLEPLNAHGDAWASIHGERWRVRSDSVLAVGARVRIVRREGLLLWVEAV